VALSLGELVAYLKADDTKLKAGLRGAQEKLKSFGKAAAVGLGVAGAAAGAALAAGVVGNLDVGEGRAKLAAQMNLSSEDSARIGKVAGQVYADNWGESLSHVNEAIRAVGQNLGDVTDMSNAELQKMTEQALALSQTFDLDLNTATEAAGKLIKNGLAKNSTEAFDIITSGMQNGADRSGDFLETLNEYAPQFAKLGYSGEQALAILQTGLKAGARDTDTVADAFKEFSIRAIDGTAQTADGFSSLGLNAEKAAAQIGKGGPAAAAMTQRVLAKLNAIKDPVERNRVGVELFGTQWEDTLRRILPSMVNAADRTEDVAGATQRMADTAGSSGKAKIETLKRGFDQWVLSMTSSNSTLGTTVAAVASFGGPALAMAGSFGQIAAGMAAFNLQATIAAVKTAVVATGTKLWAAAQWLLNVAMNANPLGLILIAIVALVGGLIYAWKHSETFRTIVLAAWSAIKAAASAVFGWITSWIRSNFERIKAVAQAVWGFISAYIRTEIAIILGVVRGVIAVVSFFRNAFESARSAVVSKVSALVSFVRSIPGKILSALGNLGNLLRDAGRKIVQGLIDGIKAMFGPLQSTFSWVTDHIPDWKGPEGKDRRLLYRPGRVIMEGLTEGLRDSVPTVRAELTGLTGALPAMIPAPRSAPGATTASGAEHARVIYEGDPAVAALLKRVVRVEFGGDPARIGG